MPCFLTEDHHLHVALLWEGLMQPARSNSKTCQQYTVSLQHAYQDLQITV